jgi:hypothetical protein
LICGIIEVKKGGGAAEMGPDPIFVCDANTFEFNKINGDFYETHIYTQIFEGGRGWLKEECFQRR